MKKWSMFAALVLMSFVFAGCRPYDVPEFKEIETSHSAFLVPLENDSETQVTFASEAFLKQHKISTKRIQIPDRWVQQGRWGK